MASHSPILLDHSPHVSLRAPSVTPSSHRKIANCASSSSPGLVDLWKLPVNKLKSGSNAQKLPDAAASGFTSAASFLKSQHFEIKEKETVRGLEEQSGNKHGGKALDKKAGKLAKPNKSRKSGQDTSLQHGTVQLPSDLLSANSINEGEASRQASIALSEFDFRPEDHHDLVSPQVAPLKPSKSKKRPSKGEGSVEGSATKKPRKRAPKTAKPPAKPAKRRFTKSESIILNSDEPEPINDDQLGKVADAVTDAISITMNESANTLTKLNSATGLQAPADRTTANVTESVTGDIDTELKEKLRYFGSRPLQDVNIVSPVLPRSNQAAAISPHFTAAHRRRMSWTPVKNTGPCKTPPNERSGTASSTESEVASKSLVTVISGFGYTEQAATNAPRARASNGEALTKKRRIELTEGCAHGPTKPKRRTAASKESKPKTKTAKKPQTITALATKAYQAETDQAPAQPTVSEFFSAAEPTPPPVAANGASNCDGVKAKKPSKPRAKRKDGDSAKGGAKKPPKTTKAKGKSKEAEVPAVLFAPDVARAQQQNQDVLFVTSSQLLLEESPTFIRDIQAAIHDSEQLIPPAFGDRDWPSRPRDQTLGTGVSLRRARKGLWDSGARDDGGSILDLDSEWDRLPPRSGSTNDVTGFTFDTPEAGDTVYTVLPELAQPPQLASAAGDLTEELDSDAEPKLETNNESPSTIAECCDLPLEAESHELESALVECMPTEPELAALPSTNADEEFLFLSPTPEPPHEEYFMPISSDHIVPELDQVDISTAQVPKISKPPMLIRSSTSPMMNRTALQSLDTNAGLLRHTSPIKPAYLDQQRALTTVSPTSQAKRPRGRPKKNEVPMSAAVSPKRRGRPPKASKAPTAALMSPTQASPRRRKNTGVSKSSPGNTTNDWLNIDEISDPDSPNTPSPPRRRASSSPPAVKPLELSPSKTNALPPTSKTSTLKATDASFAGIQATLFPRITAMIKSTPPSNDMQNPSWHEKILLYDPIVLEDLTAWLNAQGVRIETQRLKAKPKGRKKKHAADEEPKFETVEEELKPWMVQKWCEEKSICCLWKDGLRGGVKNRY